MKVHKYKLVWELKVKGWTLKLMGESKVDEGWMDYSIFSKLGKTGSWFLSILLTPFQASHKETKYPSKPKFSKNAIAILNLE